MTGAGAKLRHALATAIVCLAVGAPAAGAATGNEVLYPFHPVSDSQAVSFFNQQRAAAGIPPVLPRPDLNAQLDRALLHREEPNQVGSELCPPEYCFVDALGGGNWTATSNPLAAEPESLNWMFDPALQGLGLGQYPRGASYVLGFGQNTFENPIFFAYPSGTGVLPWEFAQWNNPSPNRAPQRVTGPYIAVYAEGDPGARIAAVTLTGPAGPVPTITLSPKDLGESFRGWEVGALKRLRPLTHYVLDVTWNNGSGDSHQVVSFWTASSQAAAHPDDCVACLHGYLHYRTRGRRLTISTYPAVGQRVLVRMEAAERVCALSIRPCPKRDSLYLTAHYEHRVIAHYRHPVTFLLPPATRTYPYVAFQINEPQFWAKGNGFWVNTLSGPPGSPF